MKSRSNHWISAVPRYEPIDRVDRDLDSQHVGIEAPHRDIQQCLFRVAYGGPISLVHVVAGTRGSYIRRSRPCSCGSICRSESEIRCRCMGWCIMLDCWDVQFTGRQACCSVHVENAASGCELCQYRHDFLRRCRTSNIDPTYQLCFLSLEPRRRSH